MLVFRWDWVFKRCFIFVMINFQCRRNAQWKRSPLKNIMDLTAVKFSLIYTWHWGLFHYNSPSITDFSYTYMIFDSFQMNSHLFFLCVWCIYIRIFVDFGLRVWVPYIYLFYFIRSNNIYSLGIFRSPASLRWPWRPMSLLFHLCSYVSKLWWKFINTKQFFFRKHSSGSIQLSNFLMCCYADWHSIKMNC